MTVVTAAMLAISFVLEPRLEQLNGTQQLVIFLAGFALIITTGIASARWLRSPTFETVFFAIVLVPMAAFFLLVLFNNAAYEEWLPVFHCPGAQD
jgi:hypothetical protein